MLKLWSFYNFCIQVEIPSDTELQLLNLIYTEHTASETENIRSIAWESNGNTTNSEMLADGENSDNIMSFCFAMAYKQNIKGSINSTLILLHLSFSLTINITSVPRNDIKKFLPWQNSWHWCNFIFKTIEMFLKAFENGFPKMQFLMNKQVFVTRVHWKQLDPGLLNGIEGKVA